MDGSERAGGGDGEGDAADVGVDGRSGRGASRRRWWAVVGGAVSVLVVAGVGVAVAGGGDAGADERGAGAGAGDTEVVAGEPAGRDGDTTTTQPAEEVTPQQAFPLASRRLEAAGTYAYAGTARWDMPPRREARDLSLVTIEGEVILPDRAYERLSSPEDQFVVETTATADTVLSRQADLAIEDITTLPYTDALTAGQYGDTAFYAGGARLTSWLTATQDRVDAGVDGEGRRVFSATVPDGRLAVAGNETTGPAELRLTLDAADDPALVEVVTVIDGTGVHVSVALSRLGEPMPRVPAPAEPRSVLGPVTAGDVERAGIAGAVELGEVPSGWALWQMGLDEGSPREGCARLSLDYGTHDLAGSFDLDVSTVDCSAMTEPWDVPFTVGPWSGTITDDGSDYTIGEVTDGTVAVAFATTLGAEDITTLLAGLVPFDPATPPTPNPALG